MREDFLLGKRDDNYILIDGEPKHAHRDVVTLLHDLSMENVSLRNKLDVLEAEKPIIIEAGRLDQARADDWRERFRAAQLDYLNETEKCITMREALRSIRNMTYYKAILPGMDLVGFAYSVYQTATEALKEISKGET